jgi:hypothetical protein
MFRTDWFRFQVLVHNGNILRLDAIVSPARRVRVVQDREQSAREFVKDVAPKVLENSSSK